METNLNSISDELSPPSPSGGGGSGSGPGRCILLLADTWNEMGEGVCGVNRSLAINLTGYKGMQIYTAILVSPSDLSPSSQKDASDRGIVLIGPSRPINDVYTKLNNNPLHVYPSLQKLIPHVTHIVGHAPVTARAAVRLQQTIYPDSRVVLFYHVIHQNLLPLTPRLPFPVGDESEMVELSEAAHVVYCVGEMVYNHYSSRFRNRASCKIDNRLFVPQCSSAVFNTNYSPDTDTDKKVNLLTIVESAADDNTLRGLDIAICAVNKIAKAYIEDTTTRPKITLTVGVTGGGTCSRADADRAALDDLINQYCTSDNLTVQCHFYASLQELSTDLSQSHLILTPTRQEHVGHVGLLSLSAGVPTLMAQQCVLSHLIKRLAVDPEGMLVPVTAAVSSVRQDSSSWRDVITAAIQELSARTRYAQQLKIALKRDEVTNAAYDDFNTVILGGIKLKHSVYHVVYEYPSRVRDKEVVIERALNNLVVNTLQQSWRLRRHPLIERSDLYQTIDGVDLPVEELADHVTDKIEEHGRRIVSCVKDTGAFVVYCPTIYSLNDLWAACDQINAELVERLTTGEENPILKEYELRAVGIKTEIAGPELLKYKNEIGQHSKRAILLESAV